MPTVPDRYKKKLDEVLALFKKKIITLDLNHLYGASELEIVKNVCDRMDKKMRELFDKGYVITSIDSRLKNGKLRITLWGREPDSLERFKK